MGMGLRLAAFGRLSSANIGYVYSFKEKVRYVCNEGHKLIGPHFRICQANGEWGDSEPTCEGKGDRKSNLFLSFHWPRDLLINVCERQIMRSTV